MRQTRDGRYWVRRWRARERVTIRQLSVKIGDPGGQLGKWECGRRDTLPLSLKVRLCQHTGLPLGKLVGRDEMALVKALVSLVARDAAAA